MRRPSQISLADNAVLNAPPDAQSVLCSPFSLAKYEIAVGESASKIPGVGKSPKGWCRLGIHVQQCFALPGRKESEWVCEYIGKGQN